MKRVNIRNLSNANCLPVKAQYCISFVCKLRGLMFRKRLSEAEGLLLVESSDGILTSAIHMLFMNFDIGVVWVNKDGIVVDKTLAKRWHPFYKPSRPACLTLEIHPDRLKDFKPGDVLSHDTY